MELQMLLKTKKKGVTKQVLKGPGLNLVPWYISLYSKLLESHFAFLRFLGTYY